MIPKSTLRCALLAATVCALGALVAGCGDGEPDAAKQAPAPLPPAVVVAPVRVQDVPVLREFIARTAAKETVEIQARVEALLVRADFDEGRPVAKDQVLFELDRRAFVAALAVAQAEVARSEADVRLAREQSPCARPTPR